MKWMILDGKPLKGRELENLKNFLKKMDLKYDEGIEYSVCILNNNYEIIGTGSVDQNVIKCIAIDPEYQGQGISAAIISHLIQYEFEKARTHIFIYTKPKNYEMFLDMGFYTILQTSDILFMENQKQGIKRFLQELRKETPKAALNEEKTIGAIVANCNPFTLGHRYLLEKALEQCHYVHLFILSDDRSTFQAEQRYEMVERGIRGMQGVVLHRTSNYIISAATFPTYFFKDSVRGEQANCKLDLELFAKRIAPELHITKRFVGTEPYCSVTGAYNKAMKEILPFYGISVEEIKRVTKGESPISASKVREYIAKNQYFYVKELVPEAVYEYLTRK